jgi:hypothetical protein
MKWYFLLVLAAAPMISSCSSDDDIDLAVESTNLDAISFETYVNKSRTADITNSSINDFEVYGYTAENADNWSTLFNGVKVSTTNAYQSRETSSAWHYNNVKYWQKDNTYKFHAIAPATNANWSFENVSNNGIVDYSKGIISFTNIASNGNGVATANGDQDLVYAFRSATGKQYNNDKVEFTFSHLLSRVNFKFRGVASNPASVSIFVKDIKIIDTYDKGDITVSNSINNATWDVSNASLSTLDFGSIQDSFTSGTVTSDAKYMIPVSDKAVSYTAVVSFQLVAAVNNCEPCIYNVEKEFALDAVKMLPGYSYSYVVDIKTNGAGSIIEPIEFTVDHVNGWTE